MAVFPAKILESTYINHNVKRFIIQKPEGYHFIPGQGTMVSINVPEWKEQLRPFTFTSLNEWPYIEFTIKIYDDHDGVTNHLGKTNAGQELLLHEVFGSITYHGPGIFLAGGSGITPFMAIFRNLFNKDQLAGNTLILSNKYAEDIIYGEELEHMLGPNFINVLTREGVVGFSEKRIDRQFLVNAIHDFAGKFYLCGPASFVKDISAHLLSLGASAESLIIEK